MNDKNHFMDRVYKILMNSPELTDADLKHLPGDIIGLKVEDGAEELLHIYEKLGEAQKRDVISFAKKCLKEERGSMA
ncbi:hypothetical protein HNQ80_000047 [Anaerosolibacter carboniphilus]|uniref:Uncharacterized protein n=1 Tax=Anaerosolibacter carboniphilus TaxID=1417629 RepID=A0A841KPE6_9FIRM|nr:hypothetical protein [Anaerosolibacter carboniphilus]MBB6213978.1 hypothetical protein [Anaerosolibacter carboniphilus]